MSRGNLGKILGLGAATILGIEIMFLAAGAMALRSTQGGPGQASESTRAILSHVPPEPRLAVVGIQVEQDRSDTLWLSGVVVNNTSNPYRYVRVSYALYDKGGAPIGKAVASRDGLQPYARWQFKTVLDDRCTLFRLDHLEGW